MSQSAMLYRISKSDFKRLEESSNRSSFDIEPIAKSMSIFQGTFMGLVFILSKDQSKETSELLDEIFNPQQALGTEYISELNEEELMELYGNGNVIRYLNEGKIEKIDSLLGTFSEAIIRKGFNAKDLNDDNVYPCAWTNDDSADIAYNQGHIVEDFKQLKNFFKEAKEDGDSILVFVG